MIINLRIKKYNSAKLLANITLFASLLPYFSFFPIQSTDIQIMGHMVSVIVLIILIVFLPDYLAFDNEDKLLVMAGMISLLYIWGNIRLDVQWLRVSGLILLGFPIYYVIKNLYKFILPKVFFVIVLVYFIVLILQIFAFDLYQNIFSRYLTSIRYIPGSNRGPGGLCLEPSQMAVLSALFLFMPFILHYDYWEKNKLLFVLVSVISIIMILVSRSASGVVLLFCLLLAYILIIKRRLFLDKIKVVFLLFIIILSFLIIQVGYVRYSRLGDFLNEIKINPLYLIYDPSFSKRFICIPIGILNLTNQPLGTGNTYIDPGVIYYHFENPVVQSMVLPEYQIEVLDYILNGFTTNSIAMGFYRMGIIFIMIIFILLKLLRGNAYSILYYILFFSFIISGSLGNSAIWLMLGLISAQRKINNKLNI
jgi:hypothetical protein